MSITEAEAPLLAGEDIAYKFTDDRGVSFWRAGSIKLDPPSTYQKTETLGAKDVREGLGLVYIEGEDQFAMAAMESGFNSLVLCTSRDARKSERNERFKKFGKRLIKINGVSEFASKISVLIGAENHLVRDITYSDAKIVRSRSEHVSEWLELNGTGNLKTELLEHLASRHLDYLIASSDAACVLTKPVSYRLERERRFLFTMPDNVTTPLIAEHKNLRQHIELLV